MAGKSGKHSSSEHSRSAHSPSHDSKRELIEPHEGDKRYVRRDAHGHFTESQDDVGRSLAADRRQHAKHASKPGQGDRGDRSR
jgi:hypothetical protein